jgi:hypothetical protein
MSNKIYRTGTRHPNYREDSINSYRVRALTYYGEKCSNDKCPFDIVEKKMLDVHHIDRNRKNNKTENLRVLCVWCHALETRKDWK